MSQLQYSANLINIMAQLKGLLNNKMCSHLALVLDAWDALPNAKKAEFFEHAVERLQER